MNSQGDPRLIMGPDGTRLQFTGGQPLMDKGLENQALISLFTHPSWCGNKFMKVPIGSDFEEACNQPLTRQSLIRIRNAGEAALKPFFPKVQTEVSNPTGHNLAIRFLISPPGSDPSVFLLERSGGSWLMQSTDPAYKRITERWRKPVLPGGGDAPLQFENGAVLEF